MIAEKWSTIRKLPTGVAVECWQATTFTEPR